MSRVGEHIQRLLDEHVAAGEIAGAVALIATGDQVQTFAAGVQDMSTGAPMRRDTIFRIMSMTKPITAAAAMILVEEGRIALDDPVARWLPELAEPRVLRTAEGGLDDTLRAARPISLEDLLTLRLGLGWVHSGPLAAEMQAQRVAPGPDPVPFPPDEFMARIGRLPLASQPGQRWLYHTGADILCALIARVADTPLDNFLQQRLFGPLGMQDTAFHVPEHKLDRLATCYRHGPQGGLVVADPARGGHYSAPPIFPSELVSTADDYLRFARMLLRRGAPLLAAETVGRMMRDHITAAQKAASPFFPGFWDHNGWGYGGAVVTSGVPDGPKPGSYGWDGGFGTSFMADPEAETITLLLTQRQMRGPEDAALAAALRRIVYTEFSPATL